MATITKVRRLANPSKRKARRAKKNPRRRKNLSAKQIKYFGTKRQKAALAQKRRNGKKRRIASKRRNPAKRRVVTVKKRNPIRRKRRAVRNPALVVTLGAVNPQKRRKNMARRRKSAKKNPRRRRRTTVAVMAPRRRRRNPGYSRRRRNPNPFTAANAKMVAGGLLGVAATKLIAGFIPAGIKSSMGQFSPVLSNAVAAFIAGWAADRFIGGPIGQGVTFGGLMQVGSSVLNMVVPGFKVGDYPIALSGMGELMPGSFVVPQNPLRQVAAPVPTNARVTMNGLTRSFGTAF